MLASYTLNESLNEPANVPQELTLFSKDGFVVGIVYLCGPKPSFGEARPGEFIVCHKAASSTRRLVSLQRAEPPIERIGTQ